MSRSRLLLLSVIAILQSLLQFAERGQLGALEFPDPALADLVDRHWIEEMQLLAAVPECRDQVGGLENRQMLGHGLPRHCEAVAELGQGLAVARMEPVEQCTPRGVRQRLEDLVHAAKHRQPKGCMSSGHGGDRKSTRLN